LCSPGVGWMEKVKFFTLPNRALLERCGPSGLILQFCRLATILAARQKFSQGGHLTRE